MSKIEKVIEKALVAGGLAVLTLGLGDCSKTELVDKPNYYKSQGLPSLP